MDFNLKLQEFNDNYEAVKSLIKKLIAKKMVKFGSGGSSNIIVVSDRVVIKMIPTFIDNQLKQQNNNDYLEFLFYKKFYEEFIKPNITPHIVGLYKRYIVDDIKHFLPTDCETFDKSLFTPNNKQDYIKDELCYLKKGYNKSLVDKKISVLVLEKCESTLDIELEKILEKPQNIKNKTHNVITFLNRVIFQLIYTLAQIQTKYPKFIHNDLFLRNILATTEIMYEPNDYVEYKFKNKLYYLPANGTYIKINDFGYSVNMFEPNSTVESSIKNSVYSLFELDNNVRDIYTFFFDLYNGPNQGGFSAIELTHNFVPNKKQRNIILSAIKKTIGRYFKYKVIDKIQSINMSTLDKKWNISESKVLKQTVMSPTEYFNKNIFGFLTKLPENGRIVKIFG